MGAIVLPKDLSEIKIIHSPLMDESPFKEHFKWRAYKLGDEVFVDTVIYCQILKAYGKSDTEVIKSVGFDKWVDFLCAKALDNINLWITLEVETFCKR